MESTIQWYDDEQTLLLYTLVGVWSTESMLTLLQQGQELIESVAQPVSVVMDFRDVKFDNVPFNLIRIARYLQENRVSNLNKTFLISPTNLMMSMLKILEKITSGAIHSVHFASSLEQALDLHHNG